MSFKPIEPKRDEFRKYLEKYGVVESLTKVFVKLLNLEERPENPMDYIRENFGFNILHMQQINDLTKELEDAKNEIKRLQSIVDGTEDVCSIADVAAEEPIKEDSENPHTVDENNVTASADDEDGSQKNEEQLKEEVVAETTTTTTATAVVEKDNIQV